MAKHGHSPKRKKKSRRQVRFLLGAGSPLSRTQRGRLKSELKSGRVKVKRVKRRR